MRVAFRMTFGRNIKLALVFGALAIAIAAMALGGWSSSPVVSESRIQGVVTEVTSRTRLDKRVVAGTVAVRTGDDVIRVQPNGFGSMRRGDPVFLLKRVHQDGHQSFQIVGRVP